MYNLRCEEILGHIIFQEGLGSRRSEIFMHKYMWSASFFAKRPKTHTFVHKKIGEVKSRVGIKLRLYHKAQPGGFYEGGFLVFYVGFINLKVYH